MRNDQVIKDLLKRFPMLITRYEKLVNRFKNINESPGAHVVYGDIFCDYIIELALSPGENSDLLKKSADFIESLAGSDDPDIVNVVELSVLERLADENVEAIIPYLGPQSRSLLKGVNTRLRLKGTKWFVSLS